MLEWSFHGKRSTIQICIQRQEAKFLNLEKFLTKTGEMTIDVVSTSWLVIYVMSP